MNAAPPPLAPKNEIAHGGTEPGTLTPDQAQTEVPGTLTADLPSASDTSIHERETLTGRWEALSRQLARLPVIMMLASLLLGLGIVQLTFQIGNSVYRSVTWQRQTQDTLRQVRELQQDVSILSDAERMAADPTYLEQLARCQGFVGGKESVVVASNAPSNPGYSCSPVRLP